MSNDVLKVYKDDYLEITMDTHMIVSMATCYIKYKKPNGSTGYISASEVAGEPTKIKGIINAGVLDVVGHWRFQPYIVLDPNTKFHGETKTIEVHDKINVTI